MFKINAKHQSVLIIGDTHIPYEHRDYLDFCKAVSKKYKCTIFTHIGDEIDNHSISYHPSSAELFSAGDELKEALKIIKRWERVFPSLKLCDSNHGSLIFRRFKSEGLPLHYLKSMQQIYDVKKWSWHDEILLKTLRGDVYLCHGKTGAYNKLAREIGCSAVQGHFHGKLEVTYANSVFHERFNMFVGCGIDRDSLAFAYGKNNIPQPILGCGVIDEAGNPHAIKMNLNSRGRWDKKI